MRINAIGKELHGENIDCIEYSPIAEIFVARALAPAVISNVKIEANKAVATLNSEQKPKAIGKNGINIRLASMLTGYEIELIEENSQKAGEAKTAIDPNALKALFKD
jgi:N utilization substance protein A